MNATEFIEGIDNLFSANANSTEGELMSKYMRYKFEFWGIKSPQRKELQKQFLKEKPLLEIENLQEVIIGLWELPQREYQYFAMEIMKQLIKEQDSDFIDFIETLIKSKSWWDTIDFLAPNLIGNLFERYPEKREYYIEKWMNSGNFWLQRTCLIFQLRYKEKTDFKLLQQLIIRLSSEQEFFIRKAIGWSLREYSKREPKRVEEFIKNTELSRLSTTEGMKFIKKQKLRP